VLIDISSKIALITGAGRGIGAGLARRFAAEGAKLVLVDNNADTLRETVAELGANIQIEAVHADVSNEADVARAIAAAIARFGRIDILINNAGIAPSGTVEMMPVDAWDENYAVNVRGVFLMCQAVIPHMKVQRWGRILNAASFAAIIPSYAFAAYASSKSAVVSMTRVVASEVGPFGITANSYAPGMVPTLMNNFATAPEERQKALLNTLSVRRWETTDDIASLLIFLASDSASYLTGSLFDVSGGKFATQFPDAAYSSAGLL
jgi:3-oxoacyl-[acyl-carrier protein] reductase